MRFLKYSLLKPCFGSLPLLVSVFSPPDWFEFCEEGAGADDAIFCSDLGRSCSWVRARPRLQQNEQRTKCYFYVVLISLVTCHKVYCVKNSRVGGGDGGRSGVEGEAQSHHHRRDHYLVKWIPWINEDQELLTTGFDSQHHSGYILRNDVTGGLSWKLYPNFFKNSLYVIRQIIPSDNHPSLLLGFWLKLLLKTICFI